MLERATGCLEIGGRRLLRLIPRSSRTRRQLHSAFWCHGAGDIDLPAWWISLLQQSPPETAARTKSIAETARECLSAGLAEGGFLDFLYPAKTLSLIHKLAVRDAHHSVQRAQRNTSQHSRPYTSDAVEPRLATECDHDHALGLISRIHQQSALEGLEAKDAANISKARKRAEAAVDKDILHWKKEYEAAWKENETRLRMYELSSGDQQCNPDPSLAKIEKLGSQLQKMLSERLLHIFETVPFVALRAEHYAWAIRASTNIGNVEQSVKLHSEALQQGLGSLKMTKTLLRFTIQHNHAQAGAEVWATWRRWKEDVNDNGALRDDALALVDKMPLVLLTQRAQAIGISAIEAIRSNGMDACLNLRDFAVVLLSKALCRKSVLEEARSTLKTFEVLSGLVEPSSKHFTWAIEQLLHAGLIESERAAVSLYENMRKVSGIVPPRHLFESLITSLSTMHDESHLKIVFKDYRDQYGIPSAEALLLAMGEMSYQGDAVEFSALLEDYRTNYGNPTDPRLYQQLLHVHSRRFEVDVVIEKFYALQPTFGFTPTIDCWNVVIAAHARVSDLTGALKWYNELVNSRIKPDINTFSTLSSLFASGGDVEAIESLIQECERRNLYLSTSIYDGLVYAHIRSGHLREAEKVVRNALTIDLAGSRTHMWNYILNATALQRDLERLQSLFQSMQAHKVPSDGWTYAALMQGLCFHGMPQAAEKILEHVMPDKQVRPTAFHYAVVIGGFINIRKVDEVFRCYRSMIANGIKPDFNIHTMLIKAAAMLDAKTYGSGLNGSMRQGDVEYEGAKSILSQLLERIDPKDISLPGPVKGVNQQRLNEAYISNYFEYLIFMTAQDGNHGEIPALFESYIRTAQEFFPGSEVSFPIKMISALMVSYRRLEDHNEVERCWYLAVSRAETLARRPGASLAEPNWVLPGRRLILDLPLLHYMQSLIAQDRTDDIETVFADLVKAGYVLSNKALNLYVQGLVLTRQPRKAIQVAEKELLKGWPGWKNSKKRTVRPPPGFTQPEKRRATYKTLVLLARAYMDIRLEFAEKVQGNVRHRLYMKGIDNPGVDFLFKEAPNVMQAVMDMPRIQDRFQDSYLRGM